MRRARLRHSSKGLPTLEASPYSAHPLFAEPDRRGVHHHRNSQTSDELEERPGFIVIRVGALMTGIDQDTFQTVSP